MKLSFCEFLRGLIVAAVNSHFPFDRFAVVESFSVFYATAMTEMLHRKLDACL